MSTVQLTLESKEVGQVFRVCTTVWAGTGPRSLCSSNSTKENTAPCGHRRLCPAIVTSVKKEFLLIFRAKQPLIADVRFSNHGAILLFNNGGLFFFSLI